MTDLTPDRRAENMRLREAATPGPYEPWKGHEYLVYAGVLSNEYYSIRCRKGVGEVFRCPDEDGCDHENPEQGTVDAAYIVAACNDLPLYESRIVELEAVVAEREKEIERLRGLIEAWRDDASNARTAAADERRQSHSISGKVEQFLERSIVYDECADHLEQAITKGTP